MRRKNKLLFGSLAAAFSIILPMQAHGQAWIGQVVGEMVARQTAYENEVKCMNGTPMVPDEVAEAAKPAARLIADYWQAVSSGAPTDVAPFYHVGKKTVWIAGGKSQQVTLNSRFTDPFASSGAQLAPMPQGIFRSGDGASSHIQWAVLDENGRLVGTYLGQLVRKAGVWKLQSLQLFGPKDYVEPLVQYCHKLNDVLPYKMFSAQNARTYAEKRATKLKSKAEKAEEKAAKAKGNQASLYREQALEARKKSDDANIALADAVGREEEVKSEVSADEARRVARKAELAAIP